MVALIPALVIGVVILLAVGKITLPKSKEEAEGEMKRDAKGAVGNTVDFFQGEGTAERARAGLGQILTDAGLTAYNAFTDPFGNRPDLTRAHYDYVRNELNIDTDHLTPFQVHDIVHPTASSQPFPVRRLNKGAMA